MKGTDTFHLGDGYYVHVNWERVDYYSGKIECYLWIGEDYKTPLYIDEMPLINYRVFTYPLRDPIEIAKQHFSMFILNNYKEQLKEIIHEEEYWKHN